MKLLKIELKNIKWFLIFILPLVWHTLVFNSMYMALDYTLSGSFWGGGWDEYSYYFAPYTLLLLTAPAISFLQTKDYDGFLYKRMPVKSNEMIKSKLLAALILYFVYYLSCLAAQIVIRVLGLINFTGFDYGMSCFDLITLTIRSSFLGLIDIFQIYIYYMFFFLAGILHKNRLMKFLLGLLIFAAFSLINYISYFLIGVYPILNMNIDMDLFMTLRNTINVTQDFFGDFNRLMDSSFEYFTVMRDVSGQVIKIQKVGYGLFSVANPLSLSLIALKIITAAFTGRLILDSADSFEEELEGNGTNVFRIVVSASLAIIAAAVVLFFVSFYFNTRFLITASVLLGAVISYMVISWRIRREGTGA